MDKNTKITFIIPSIGRETLKDTIISLLNQTRSEWKAIVVFDGVEPTFQTTDKRITILKTQRVEKEFKNSAGYVRNYGIQFATTEWVAFVDDDDTICNDYVERFLEEIDAYDNDVIIFRMMKYLYIAVPERLKSECIEYLEKQSSIEKKINLDNYKYTPMEGDTFVSIIIKCVYPFETTDNFYDSEVGISFAVKRFIFQTGIQFNTSRNEDFLLLDSIRNRKYKMMISPHIVYIVRDTRDPGEYNPNRVFINH